MNICIALKKTVLAYICYKSTLEIDINSVKEFFNVLSKSSHNVFIVSSLDFLVMNFKLFFIKDNQLTKDTLLELSKKVTSLTGLYT
jgi:hypothetical protein